MMVQSFTMILYIFIYIYSVNIKFGTKFIIALSDISKKIARTGRPHSEKCPRVTCNLSISPKKNVM
jgi:hypothetical protein